MAKSAIYKLLTEILYGIEKLILHPIYRQTLNKEHFAEYLPIHSTFYAKLCGSWRGIKARVERQTMNNKQSFWCQASLRNLPFHLVQCISLHFKSPDLYLFCKTKVFPKLLLPFESSRMLYLKWRIWFLWDLWLCTKVAVTGRVPSIKSWSACSCKPVGVLLKTWQEQQEDNSEGDICYLENIFGAEQP